MVQIEEILETASATTAASRAVRKKSSELYSGKHTRLGSMSESNSGSRRNSIKVEQAPVKYKSDIAENVRDWLWYNVERGSCRFGLAEILFEQYKLHPQLCMLELGIDPKDAPKKQITKEKTVDPATWRERIQRAGASAFVPFSKEVAKQREQSKRRARAQVKDASK